MTKDLVPAAAIDAVKAVLDVCGSKEVSALSRELNSMSREQLEALGKRLPAIQQQEAAIHNNVPKISLTENATVWDRQSGRVDLSIKLDDPMLDQVYHRAFIQQADQSHDIRFNPFTDKMTYLDSKFSDGPLRHSVFLPSGVVRETFTLDGKTKVQDRPFLNFGDPVLEKQTPDSAVAYRVKYFLDRDWR